MSGRFRGIALTAALAALAFAAPAAQAKVGGFGGGDGPEPGGNCPPVLAWSCRAPSQYVATPDPPAASDVVFGGGEKEQSPDQWTFTPGSATSKSDALGAWSYSFT